MQATPQSYHTGFEASLNLTVRRDSILTQGMVLRSGSPLNIPLARHLQLQFGSIMQTCANVAPDSLRLNRKNLQGAYSC